MPHTPGPWTTDPEFNHQAVLGPDGKMVADCAIFHKDISDARNTANGRLVSAAPELLEALKAVVSVADRNTVEFDLARSAIAKATGRN